MYDKDLLKPLVTVCMITYNHEEYVGRAIQSYLNQCIDFPVLLIIGDDYSIDKTYEICEYFQNLYPEKIKLLGRNTCNIGASKNFIRTYSSADSKYIALLEGDDYWTDTFKLQKQIDFLETHTEYVLCSHGYNIVNSEGEFLDSPMEDILLKFPQGYNITVDNFFDRWLTKTLTTVFRKNAVSFNFEDYKVISDSVLFFNILLKGKGYWMSFNGGCYTMHTTGMWSAMKGKGQLLFAYNRYLELFIRNKNVFSLRNALLEKMRQIIDFNMHPNNKSIIDMKELFRLCMKYYQVAEDKIEAKKYLKNNVLAVLILRIKISTRKAIDRKYKEKYNHSQN